MMRKKHTNRDNRTETEEEAQIEDNEENQFENIEEETHQQTDNKDESEDELHNDEEHPLIIQARPEVEPQFRDPPTFIQPTKGEVIKYFRAATDSWISATITSIISGYNNNWFNIQHEDSSRCSVELTKDTLWKFDNDEKNEFYRWRWSHIKQGI